MSFGHDLILSYASLGVVNVAVPIEKHWLKRQSGVGWRLHLRWLPPQHLLLHPIARSLSTLSTALEIGCSKRPGAVARRGRVSTTALSFLFPSSVATHLVLCSLSPALETDAVRGLVRQREGAVIRTTAR